MMTRPKVPRGPATRAARTPQNSRWRSLGDLAYSDVHPYLLEPDAPAWLAQLDRARALFAGGVTLLPGHGLPGGLELLDRQEVYLETYRAQAVLVASDHGWL
jgi:glyoxylase-like metal-dependent hydrolase (beta-lactamase superfamily II)